MIKQSISRYIANYKSDSQEKPAASMIVVKNTLIPYLLSAFLWLGISIALGVLLSRYLITEKLPQYAMVGLMIEPTKIVLPVTPAPLCARNIEKMLAKNIIHFNFNSAELSQRGRKMVNKIIEELQGCEKATLLIEGHTDNIGHPERNLRLSKQRADTVAKVIKDSDLTGFTIKTVGRGATEPIASNNTKQGRYENRRIEIHWVKSY